jgi:hypothetical protein
MAAARQVTPREVPLMVALMAVRSLPALLRRRRPRSSGSILDGFRRGGFVVLEERPHELVAGGVGRFWQPSGGLRRVAPDRFRDFSEPGWAKAAFNFRVEREGAWTLLSTETRVLATDDGARRRFGRYWRLIRPCSSAIRVAWLRAIRRRAESQASSSDRADSRRSTSASVV